MISDNGKGIWAERQLAILRALERRGGQEERDALLRLLSQTRPFTTKGPREKNAKPPDYYFGQALRWLTSRDRKYVTSSKGSLYLTDAGQGLLRGIATQAPDRVTGMTSMPRFWEIIQQVLPSRPWTKLQDLYDLVRKKLNEDGARLTRRDREPAGETRTALVWHHTVRNALEAHKGTEVEKGKWGQWRRKLGSQPPDPPGRVISAEEWRRQLRVHRTIERKQSLVKLKKQTVLEAKRRLSCEVCEFDFAAFYGALGCGFAECHHVRPLAEARSGDVTTLKDLAIVCANCHRILHRRPKSGRLAAAPTIQKLKSIVRRHRK